MTRRRAFVQLCRVVISASGMALAVLCLFSKMMQQSSLTVEQPLGGYVSLRARHQANCEKAERGARVDRCYKPLHGYRLTRCFQDDIKVTC